MPGQSASSRLPWTDKFKAPSLDDLRRSMPDKHAAALLDDARQAFLKHPGVVESIAWKGVPWRWTLVFGTDRDATRALGYVIPDPARIQVCVPLTVEMVQTLPFRRLKKAVRDGIVFSRAAGDVHWPSWDVTAPGMLHDVQELLDRKVKFLTARESLAASG